MDNIPNKLELTCTVTGKKSIWTNKKIIAAKIAEFGTLEAFVNQYTCRGAGKKPSTAVVKSHQIAVKEILNQGQSMNSHETSNDIEVRTYTYKDGPSCTVVTTKPSAPAPFDPAAQEPKKYGKSWGGKSI